MIKQFTAEEAKQIGDQIGVDWNKTILEEFRMGLAVELEHGSKYGAQTNVTNDDILLTGRIVLAHLFEIRDYYTRLAKMEEEGEAYWEGK